jgi:DNA-directed RNA polymerase specialized sigma subunit
MSRRGFVHWLGDLPEPLSEEEKLIWYPKLFQGDREAKSIVATRHFKLVFFLCAKYAFNYSDTDELVATALFATALAVDRLVSKTPDYNVSGFIVKYVTGALNNLVKERKALPISSSMKVDNNFFEILECREIVSKCFEGCRNQYEKMILTMRIQGNTDREIAEVVKLTPARVGQIRAEIRQRMEYLLE